MVFSIIVLSLFSFADDHTESYRFKMAAGSEFSLDSHKGNIVIRRHEGNELKVEVRIWDNYQGTTLDRVNVSVEQQGNRVHAEVDYDDSSFSDGWKKRDMESPSVDFTVSIPDNCALTIDDHKSTFDVEATMGDLRIESHKGNGRIYNVAGPLSLETHKGQFEVVFSSFQGARVETHKGHLNLIMGPVSDVNVRANTHKGDIQFLGVDAQMKRDHDDHEYSARFTKGAGTQALRIETHKGEITVDMR